MNKVAMFVFNGSPICFVHVLLNALDMHGRGDAVQIVMEGEATQLVAELAKPDNWLHNLWQKACGENLVAGACNQMGEFFILSAPQKARDYFAKAMGCLTEFENLNSLAQVKNL